MAVRIAGVTIPNTKRVVIGLTYIFGIGTTQSQKILQTLQISQDVRVQNLSEDEINKIRSYIEGNYRVEGDLKRDILSNIKRLKEIGSYRGSRHAKRLPVRGQRTKTNSRTVRGNKRVTMGSGRKESGTKT